MDINGEKLIKQYRRHGKTYMVLCNGIDHWCVRQDGRGTLLVGNQRFAGFCDCVEG